MKFRDLEFGGTVIRELFICGGDRTVNLYFVSGMTCRCAQRWGQMFFSWTHLILLLWPLLFQVQLLESIFNYYASYIIYPSLNGKNSCY